MELEFEVESLDSVEEAFRGLYEQHGKGYRLKVKGAVPKAHAETLLKEKQALAGKAGLEEFSLDEFKRLKEAEAERTRKEAEARGEYEKLITQLRESHRKEKEKLQAELESVRSRERAYRIDSELTAEIARAGGNPRVLLPIMRERVRVEEVADGKGAVVRLVPLSPGGEPMAPGDKGEAATLSDLVKSFATDDDYKPVFRGAGAFGGGATGSAGLPSSQSANPFAKGKENLTEQAKLYRSNPALARRLREEADATN